MRIIKFSYLFAAILFVAACPAWINAQTVTTRTDRNQILIGERMEYDLFVTLPSTDRVFFDLPDSINHFDVLDKGVFDSTRDNGAYNLRRSIIFTSFDSGSWYIPSLPITIGSGNDAKRFLTDSVLVNVGYAPADSSGELRDI